MENQVVENQNFNDGITDSFVFSVTYSNYIKNIKNDKEDRTQGHWNIDANNFSKLKYAYAYLVGSKKMIVKKFHIQRFEYAKKEKGYPNQDKVCFIFSKSEDVFFEYPFDIQVQGHHYRSSKIMDNSPMLEQADIDERLKQSENTPEVEYKPKSKTTARRIKKHNLTPREKLVSVYTEKFKHKKFNDFSKITELEKQVEQGQEAETVLTNYFNSLDN